MSRIVRRTVAPAALLTAALAVPAVAHLGNPDYRSVVRAIEPATDGLSAQVIDHDDALLLVNRSGQEVVVFDADGKPFARLRADGAVQVNARSELARAEGIGDGGDAADDGAEGRARASVGAALHAAAPRGSGGDRAGAGPTGLVSDASSATVVTAGDGALLAHAGHDHGDEPAPARPGRAAERPRKRRASPWVTVARTGRFQWHEDRIKYREAPVPPQVTDRAQRTKVMDWQVPIAVAGQQGAIVGTLWWVGEPGGGSSFPTAALVSLAVIAVAAVAVVAVVRRRRAAG